jgi:hypothetical protein
VYYHVREATRARAAAAAVATATMAAAAAGESGTVGNGGGGSGVGGVDLLEFSGAGAAVAAAVGTSTPERVFPVRNIHTHLFVIVCTSSKLFCRLSSSVWCSVHFYCYCLNRYTN